MTRRPEVRDRRMDAGVNDRTLNAALKHREREVVERALVRAGGNVADAAAAMGILRTSLYRIMKRHSIPVPSHTRR